MSFILEPVDRAARALAVGLAMMVLGACSTRSLSGIENVGTEPMVAAAAATCEARRQRGDLVSYEQVAECERAIALPEEQRQAPDFKLLYEVVWCNQIDLYRQVDRGRLTKPAADRQQAIDRANMIDIIRSIRRF